MANTAKKAKPTPLPHVDVGKQQIGQVYARALLGASEEAGQSEAVMAELESLVADVLDRNRAFEDVLASGLIDPAEKVQIIDRVFGPRASTLVLNFLKVLARHGRLDCLRAIHRAAIELYAELRNRVTVSVRTATALDPALAREIAATLRAMLGGEPQVETAVDPAVIGGMVLRVGDTVYDGSVATQLKRARAQMIDRSIHEIQSGRDRFRTPEGN